MDRFRVDRLCQSIDLEWTPHIWSTYAVYRSYQGREYGTGSWPAPALLPLCSHFALTGYLTQNTAKKYRYSCFVGGLILILGLPWFCYWF